MIEPSKEVLAGLRDRIFEAAETLRKLPDKERVWLTSAERSAWPPIAMSYWEAYGQHRARMRPMPASARQISDMELVMSWLTWLGRQDRDTMRCVFACCGMNLAPSQAASEVGFHRNTVRLKRDEGLRKIAQQFVLGTASCESAKSAA